MPDWTFVDYIKVVAKTAGFLAKNAMKFAVSIAIIVVFVVVVAFKDRFLKVAGLDNKTLFRFKIRDVFGAGNLRAIEIQILKVEDLENKSMFAPNNVFVETTLGYNEPMKTRVHNNAGTTCTIKETLQLNFDDEEDEEVLFIYVKNQKVVGSAEIGRIELSAETIVQIEKECGKPDGGDPWNPKKFISRNLMPRGRIHFRINAVEDEDANALGC
jgi:hypothetical protein